MCVVAPSAVSISLVTPKKEPVSKLIRINAMDAANAPPARSLAQEPPIATANNRLRLLITPHPILETMFPIHMAVELSFPKI